MRRLFPAFLVGLLVVVVLRHAAVEFEWLYVRWLIVAYFVFGIVGFAWRAYRRWGAGRRFGAAAAGYALLGSFLAWAVVEQAEVGFYEPGRVVVFGLVFAGFVAFVAASVDASFYRRTGAYLAAFVVFLFAIFTHLPALAVRSGLISYAVQAGFLLGLNLFVLPRYVPKRAFLWVTAGISGIVMAASLPVYLVGEYSLFGLPVRLWGTTFALPVIGAEPAFLQSVFPNPNDAGLLAFAGAVCAAVLAHRSTLGAPVSGTTVLAGGLAAINGLALLLTHSRASWLAAAVAVGVYAGGVRFGRARLPHAVVVAAGLTALFLLAAFLSVIDIDASGRFALWGAGLRAIADNPSLLGGGMVASDEVIAPYLDGRFRGYSAHNSYVVIFLRAGLVGGAAYLLLTIGSVLDVAARRPQVDASMVALAAGFAVHQLFESYTLFQFGVGSVVGALAVGYLVVEAPGLPTERTARLWTGAPTSG